jgi:transposase
MSPKKKVVANLKEKIRRRIKKGMTINGIAEQLEISRSRASRIVEELKTSKRNWNNKSRVLDPYTELIRKLVEDNNPPASIHEFLIRKKMNVSLSTVQRFVASLKQSKIPHKKPSDSPEAIVSFVYAGKLNKNKKKIDVWMFCMQLMGTSYKFYEEVRHADIATFINCHVNAFYFLKGSPHIIHLNHIDQCLIKTECFSKAYTGFLNYFGVHYRDEHVSLLNGESCHELFKGSFFKSIINREYSQFAKELKRWFTCSNLARHPFLKMNIKKAFEQTEQPFLLPLPQKPYPSTGTCIRKVNQRGYLFFEYNWYQVPKDYSNKLVVVTFYAKKLKISFDNNLIALHTRSYSQKIKIKLV